ncbi:hypothetical protein V6N12_014850 [Hibiscus sabdariffa]|uniref:Uncharacterized protein n=1 Tax=Hibiscus sabdariffa TaxID=183260 RepID=A0ABR2DLE9_9ROSI
MICLAREGEQSNEKMSVLTSVTYGSTRILKLAKYDWVNIEIRNLAHPSIFVGVFHSSVTSTVENLDCVPTASKASLSTLPLIFLFLQKLLVLLF